VTEEQWPHGRFTNVDGARACERLAIAASPITSFPFAAHQRDNVDKASFDLAHVISIGTRGGRVMARLYEDGELRPADLGPT
jgi:hypothetical protein